MKPYKSLFTEVADKEIYQDGIHFIYHNGGNVTPELTEYERNAVGKGTSIDAAIRDAVRKIAFEMNAGQAADDFLVKEIIAMVKGKYDIKGAISPEQLFLPGTPKQFAKGLHFVEVALDDDYVGPVVEAIIKYINDGEQSAIDYVSSSDYAESHIDLAWSGKTGDNVRLGEKIKRLLEDKEISEDDFLEMFDESDVESQYVNSPFYQNTGGVILNSYEVGEYEDQLDNDHTIKTEFGEIGIVDAIASLSPKQFKYVNDHANGHIQSDPYRSKDSKWHSVIITYYLGGNIEVFIPEEKALAVLGEKTKSSKIGKVRELKKLAAESTTRYRRLFT